jgi:hypothetical protein
MNPKTRSAGLQGIGLNRREFLAGAALAGVGLAIASMTPAAQAGSSRPNLIGKANMQNRKLGSLEVSALGAGAMSISANYAHPPTAPKASRRCARRTRRA